MGHMTHKSRCRCTFPVRTAGPRRGAVLVEFALVAFALYLLLVALLDLGRGALAVQTLQRAADALSQELSRAPIGATLTFEEALDHAYVKTRIYDEECLVVDLSGLPTSQDIDSHFAGLPIVNQILRPLMLHDYLPDGTEVMRYPGALVNTPGGGRSVWIPLIIEYSGTPSGVRAEKIRWVPVVQEILPASDPTSHFAINSGGPFAGMVNARINYPYQAATLSGFHLDEPPGPDHIVVASDAEVQEEGSLPADYTLIVDADAGPSSPYSGRYGLGHHYAFLKRARPFRKVIRAQAAARREVIFDSQ